MKSGFPFITIESLDKIPDVELVKLDDTLYNSYDVYFMSFLAAEDVQRDTCLLGLVDKLLADSKDIGMVVFFFEELKKVVTWIDVDPLSKLLRNTHTRTTYDKAYALTYESMRGVLTDKAWHNCRTFETQLAYLVNILISQNGNLSADTPVFTEIQELQSRLSELQERVTNAPSSPDITPAYYLSVALDSAVEIPKPDVRLRAIGDIFDKYVGYVREGSLKPPKGE